MSAQVNFDWAKSSKPPKPFAKDRNAAQNAQTSLIQTRTDAYNSMFAPVSREIRDLAVKPLDIEAARDAGARGAKLFDIGVGALEREQRGLGTGPVAGQAQRLGLRRTLAEVDAANRKISSDESLREFAQRASVDEYMQRMAGAGDIYGQLAGMELNRKAQYRTALAQRDASIMGMVGTAAGIAMAV